MRLDLPGRWTGELSRQGLRFAVVGSLATVIQLGLYAFLSGSVGAQLANIMAWLVSTLIGNFAHHRYTFKVARVSTHLGPQGRFDDQADHLVGLFTSLAGLGIGSLALDMLGNPTGLAGTIALVGVNSAVGALRFITLHQWFGRTALTPPVVAAFASGDR